MTRRNPTKRRSISLKIDADVIAQLLRLDPTMRILGARSEIHGDQHVIVFAVDAPKAPAEALEFQPTYAQAPGPDPIRLAFVDWLLRNGDRFRQSFGPPSLATGPDGEAPQAEMDAYLKQLRATSTAPSEQDIADVNAARAQAGAPPLELPPTENP